MALFGIDDSEAPSGRGRSRRIGGWLFTVAILGVCLFALVPSPYVIDVPGPVFNTLGEVTIDGKKVPLIEIPGETTYPTDGALDLLTVSTVGDRGNTPTWFEVVTAWFDPSKAVLPLDSVYPPGYSVEQSNEDGRVMMANSQKDAIAAALTELGYDLPVTVTVGSLTENSPSDGILEPGDVILSVGGRSVVGVEDMRSVIAENGVGKPIEIEITRNGEPMTVSIVPELSDENPPAPIVGVYPAIDYDYPFEVKIQLQNVGGPSGGQMFALGIIDKLTPGELNGGERVAGTGTIDAAGKVGPIGGIRQKLYGALRAGATWFLAPKANCDEVVGHVPDGLHVVAVSTLEDSLAALTAIESGRETGSLPSCATG
ncbi:PDZ domain-containing protein [Leifsonia bigeumensis]|uniref:endopeptidase La n=1 Tax=Leifsonella bigeumensis TaxID=433643 RepID=A0ABP7FYB5_9MICO